MSSAVQNIPKPQLRGLLRSYLKKHISLAIVTGILGSLAWNYGVAQPRKKAYAEFYKTYDAEADYERMKKLNILPPFPSTD